MKDSIKPPVIIASSQLLVNGQDASNLQEPFILAENRANMRICQLKAKLYDIEAEIYKEGDAKKYHQAALKLMELEALQVEIQKNKLGYIEEGTNTIKKAMEGVTTYINSPHKDASDNVIDAHIKKLEGIIQSIEKAKAAGSYQEIASLITDSAIENEKKLVEEESKLYSNTSIATVEGEIKVFDEFYEKATNAINSIEEPAKQ